MYENNNFLETLFYFEMEQKLCKGLVSKIHFMYPLRK